MKLSEFEFTLPQELIAQYPLPHRDHSRMMVVRRESKSWEHQLFADLPHTLTPEHFLVVNNTKVFPARLRAQGPGKEKQIEVLLTREQAPGLWLALVRPARRVPVGQVLEIGGLRAQVIEQHPFGRRLLRIDPHDKVQTVLEEIGEPPLPPYIHRTKGANFSQDRERYQTVFARHRGSIAAPTAGLHFTPEVLRRLEQRGIHRCEILLHVGYGTFQPIRSKEIEEHTMEAEYFEADEESAACIRRLKAEHRRLVAVGTTTTRALEYLAHRGPFPLRGGSGWCDLFIYPGFQFRILDGLLTNFHLPASTLLMLVCAFAGRELMLECYKEAIAQRYRFYSYGDCMLIL